MIRDAFAAVPALAEVIVGAPVVFRHTGGRLDAVAETTREST